jgi:hypothetical protein
LYDFNVSFCVIPLFLEVDFVQPYVAPEVALGERGALVGWVRFGGQQGD